jgi:ATP-dependent RNA helicase DDX51/DBP6
MFNVGRYDPNAKKHQNSLRKDESSKSVEAIRKRKKLQQHNDNQQPSSLRIIADETKAPTSRVSKLQPEAYDDLDLLDELISDEPVNDHDLSPELSEISHHDLQMSFKISQLSIEQAANGWQLAPFLVENLRRDGFKHFFPIQALAIPDVIASERHLHVRSQDVCITAPTGSGKTLSYVLPILNSLSSKGGPRRLRALVVLPSRDLATQVYNVFERYVVGSLLRVGLAIGQSDFVAEQMALTVDETSSNTNMLRNRLSFDPGNLDLALRIYGAKPFLFENFDPSTKFVPVDGWSNVDILVCTPGRLVDHIDNTPGFTLQHLRFLVVDEADRLLSQSYHKWIDRVIESSNIASVTAWKNMSDGNLPRPLKQEHKPVNLEPITWRRGGIAGDDSDHFDTNESCLAAKVCQTIQLRKFLVSATLTRDPQKLASLRLVNPKHFNVHQLKGEVNKYSMPASLAEFIVECTAEQKPMVLLSLLVERLNPKVDKRKSLTVIFTSSIDSTHRMARLLQLLWGALKYGSDTIGEFSSALNQEERTAVMSRCNDPNSSLSIVVCTDGMSRGLDLDFIDTVINYDIPTLAKTYVHRCGRTARASRKGTAVSLVKGGQYDLFYRMRHLIQDAERVQIMTIKRNLVSNAINIYKLCLKSLREVLDAEANGEIGRIDNISNFLPDP